MASKILNESTLRLWLEVAQQHWKLSLGAGMLLIPVLTFIITTTISWIGMANQRDGREPPLNPYWFPFLGDWLEYLLARKSFLNRI
jgi:hypothetical protein